MECLKTTMLVAYSFQELFSSKKEGGEGEQGNFKKMVLEEGLEPTLLTEPDPKSGASANFAIRASLRRWLSFGSGTRRKEGPRHSSSPR